jgi:hypothetical protein
MNCQRVNAEKLKKILEDPNWCIQLKRDGCRCIIKIDEQGIATVFGRKSGKKTTIPLEISKNLPSLTNYKFPKEFRNCVLDAEIFNSNKTAAEVAGAINPNRVKGPVEWEPNIQYWVFDMPYYQNNYYKDPLRVRLLMLKKLFASHDFKININLVNTYTKSKALLLNKWLTKGEEGAVLKNLSAQYILSFEDEGARPINNWVKIKRGCEGDYIIIGYDEPTHYYTGKDIENWKYWEYNNGRLYNGPKHFEEDKPITKAYFHQWPGSIKYGLYMTQEQIDKYNPMEIYKKSIEERTLVTIGNVSGLTDEFSETLKTSGKYYKGKVIELGGMQIIKETQAIRHPYILRLREDKAQHECYLKEGSQTKCQQKEE